MTNSDGGQKRGGIHDGRPGESMRWKKMEIYYNGRLIANIFGDIENYYIPVEVAGEVEVRQ